MTDSIVEYLILGAALAFCAAYIFRSARRKFSKTADGACCGCSDVGACIGGTLQRSSSKKEKK